MILVRDPFSRKTQNSEHASAGIIVATPRYVRGRDPDIDDCPLFLLIAEHISMRIQSLSDSLLRDRRIINIFRFESKFARISLIILKAGG